LGFAAGTRAAVFGKSTDRGAPYRRLLGEKPVFNGRLAV
jgi:hypothetical protein